MVMNPSTDAPDTAALAFGLGGREVAGRELQNWVQAALPSEAEQRAAQLQDGDDGDQREFGGHEEPVGEHEGNDGEERKRGTNGTILIVAGATGPGTRGDRRTMRPGSPEDSSAISGDERSRSVSSLVIAGREEHDEQSSHEDRGPQT